MESRISSLFRRRGQGDECDHVRGMSSDFIDDELDPEERDWRWPILSGAACVWPSSTPCGPP